MKTIHKYELNAQAGLQEVRVRAHATLLKLAVQGNKIMLWYEVDTLEAWQTINFAIYETGQAFLSEIKPRCKYLDTVQLDGRDWVLHIYRID